MECIKIDYLYINLKYVVSIEEHSDPNSYEICWFDKTNNYGTLSVKCDIVNRLDFVNFSGKYSEIDFEYSLIGKLI